MTPQRTVGFRLFVQRGHRALGRLTNLKKNSNSKSHVGAHYTGAGQKSHKTVRLERSCKMSPSRVVHRRTVLVVVIYVFSRSATNPGSFDDLSGACVSYDRTTRAARRCSIPRRRRAAACHNVAPYSWTLVGYYRALRSFLARSFECTFSYTRNRTRRPHSVRVGFTRA